MEAEDDRREFLLRENPVLADVRLAHSLKDICLEGWSSDPARALAAAQALKLLNRLFPEPETEALQEWCIGLEFLIQGEMELAIAHLDLSQDRFVKLQNANLAASTQVSKLIALAMLGRYDEAVECGLRAREVFEATGDSLALGKIEHNIGNIYFRRDRYSEAERFQRSARAHFESVGDQIQLAKIENSLALTLSQQHLTKAAEQLYEQALARATEVKLKSTQAEIESSIGTLALYQGYYDRALDFLERSRRKYAELNLPHVLAMTEQEIADAYLELNLVPEAIEIYERVAVRFSKLGMLADEAHALAYQGRAEITVGNLTRAQNLLSKARALYIREGNEVGAALVELSEAQLFCVKKDYISTEIAARHVEKILTSAGNPRRVIFARWLQGEAARLDQRPADAKTLLESALTEAWNLTQPDIVARCLTSLGLLAEASGDGEQAERQFRSAVEVIETLRAPLPGEEFRNAYFSDKLIPYTALARISLSCSPPRISEALLYVEKARSRSLVDALAGRLKMSIQAEDEFDLSLLKDLDEKRHELTYFYSQLNQTPDPHAVRTIEETTELQDEVRQRESAIAEITRQLRHSRHEAGGLAEELDLQRLKRCLGADKALVEFTFQGDELIAFVVTDTLIDVVRELGLESEIVDGVSKFRFQIDSLRFGSSAIRRHLDVLTKRIEQHLQSLYEQLLRPIRHLLGERDLIIVPTGHLHYLPFHALHDGDQYLIESRAVSYASSATVLQQCLHRTQPDIDSVLIFGVADDNTPQINSEIEQLRVAFPRAKVFSNDKATQAALKEHCMDADLVHLACHAQFRADNPQFSALRLGDGWLTVSDAYNLQLRCGLVTLSACETGVSAVSPGEELIGLARGFLSAGAASVLLSLWTVDDEATQRLMDQFYRELLVLKSPAKALQRAQVDALQSKSHPFFWSPFVLVGRW